MTKPRPVEVPNHLLRAAREARGWTQNHLAELLGVSARTILRWEAGLTKPSPRMLHRIFGTLEIGHEIGLDRQDGPSLVRELELFKDRAERAEQRIEALEAELARLHSYSTSTNSYP